LFKRLKSIFDLDQPAACLPQAGLAGELKAKKPESIRVPACRQTGGFIVNYC
jgi:hypothetical protein